ncbi:MAG: hypothetical protein ACUVWX_08250 [Kiritimatiellia bacterium]
MRVFSNKCLRFRDSATIPVDFAGACEVFQRTSLLADAQEAYARYLDPQSASRIKIRETGPGTYEYVNPQGYVSYIRQLDCDMGVPTAVTLRYYVTGHRFFGRFHGLILIEVVDRGAQGIAYTTDARVYVENPVMRVCASKLSLVRSYLERRVRRLINNLADGCWALCISRRLERPDPAQNSADRPLAIAATDAQNAADR